MILARARDVDDGVQTLQHALTGSASQPLHLLADSVIAAMGTAQREDDIAVLALRNEQDPL